MEDPEHQAEEFELPGLVGEAREYLEKGTGIVKVFQVLVWHHVPGVLGLRGSELQYSVNLFEMDVLGTRASGIGMTAAKTAN